jgi:hypothetical protein
MTKSAGKKVGLNQKFDEGTPHRERRSVRDLDYREVAEQVFHIPVGGKKMKDLPTFMNQKVSIFANEAGKALVGTDAGKVWVRTATAVHTFDPNEEIGMLYNMTHIIDMDYNSGMLILEGKCPAGVNKQTRKLLGFKPVEQ